MRNPYRLDLRLKTPEERAADKARFHREYAECWHCTRPVERKFMELGGSWRFFQKPTCRFCEGQMFGMRGRYFAEEGQPKCRPYKNKKAHDHMIEWQMWSIYLKAQVVTLKQAIRLKARE